MNIMAWLLIAVLAVNPNEVALQNNPPPSSVQTSAAAAEQATEKVKTEVQKRGTGEQARVRVTLRDGTRIKGYINRIDQNSFEVVDQTSHKVTTISYQDVKKIKGPGLSKTVKILIIVAVVAGIVLALVALACSSEGGPHC